LPLVLAFAEIHSFTCYLPALHITVYHCRRVFRSRRRGKLANKGDIETFGLKPSRFSREKWKAAPYGVRRRPRRRAGSKLVDSRVGRLGVRQPELRTRQQHRHGGRPRLEGGQEADPQISSKVSALYFVLHSFTLKLNGLNYTLFKIQSWSTASVNILAQVSHDVSHKSKYVLLFFPFVFAYSMDYP
jgi:hypothetical protein